MNANTETLTLLADIGGTYARFARVARVVRVVRTVRVVPNDASQPASEFVDMKRYETANTTFQDAVIDFVAGVTGSQTRSVRIDVRVAVAAPVMPAQQNGDTPVQLTNNDWIISRAVLAETFSDVRLNVLNDFAAVAMALPHLAPNELTRFTQGETSAVALPKLAIGSGTGLGVASIVPVGNVWQVLPGEGGHVTLGAANEREHAIIAYVRTRFPHVSAERLLSGTGLPLLHEAVCHVDTTRSNALSAPEITTAAQTNEPAALATLQTFASMLGSVAGNAALTVGALGGVYLAGGLIQRWQSLFPVDVFTKAFTAKGRFQSYLERVPVYRIDAAEPGLIGLARGLVI